MTSSNSGKLAIVTLNKQLLKPISIFSSNAKPKNQRYQMLCDMLMEHEELRMDTELCSRLFTFCKHSDGEELPPANSDQIDVEYEASSPPVSLSKASSPPVSLSKASSPLVGLSKASSPPVGLSKASSPPVSLSKASSPLVGLSKASSPPVGLSKASSPPVSLSKASSPPKSLSLAEQVLAALQDSLAKQVLALRGLPEDMDIMVELAKLVVM
ncbi:hypothetical protein MBANPS3_007519 [Mucor bainieri]